MTDQRELDRILGAFFAEGTDELADRVIDAALDHIDHIPQRRAMRAPWRFPTMTMPTRLAAAAVIGALAVGGALYLIKPGQPAVGGPSPTPGSIASPSLAATTPAPTRSPTPARVPDPTPDIPSLAGPMVVGRQIHTATALADGRVLVAGGYDNKDAALASAVLYDPRTDTYSPTGSLTDARGYHTSTRLSDGHVLITGGGPASWIDPSPYLASAELYDPTTGTFSPTGSMTMMRTDHTATLLADGRVLITGGNRSGDQTTTGAEVYDPKTGRFSATGSMAAARGFHTATLLVDGRVLVVGGNPNAWSFGRLFLDSAELYDPKTGTFSPTGSMASARAAHTATRLSDGRVLISGGGNDVSEGGAGDSASAEIYDPKTGTFSATGSMTDARVYHTATLLSDGRVLVAGGGGNYTDRKFLNSAELYDPRTGTFSVTGPMIDARTYHAAAVLGDGRVLLTGGYGALAPLASAEIYDPKTSTFSPAGDGR